MTQPMDAESQAQAILKAASSYDNESLEKFLRTFKFEDCEAANVLDAKTLQSPLHVAVASCKPELNGNSDGESGESQLKAAETIKLLFENGAIWNQLDKEDETPGCIAKRLGLDYLYQLLVDAGVRAEMLLSRLEGYEQLNDDEGDPHYDHGYEDEESDDDERMEEDVTALEQHEGIEVSNEVNSVQGAADVNSAEYLSSTLSFTKDKLLDDQQNGVMMEWERGIMKQSADNIVDKPGLKVLNIGAGMLIFDTIVAESENKPESHHIIEAHPDVIADMKSKGWFEKPGVTVHEGKWQDVLPDLIAENETFDAIYFDTFAESYSDFRDFLSEQVIGLLTQEGKWSFFNGMGADRQISYDVYQKVVEMDLFESGFDVEWQEIAIPTLNHEWEGVKRKYWNIDTYRLPICKFMD